MITHQSAVYTEESPLVLTVKTELPPVERTSAKRVEFIDWLTLMIGEQLILAVCDVALTAEVCFFLPAVGNCSALLALIADRITGVILLLAIEGEYHLILNYVL